MMRKQFTGAALAMALFVSACGEKQPEGQVVATIDGEEVTLQELDAEARANNIPPNADRKTVLPVVLQRVVERKLLAKAAAQQGVDKSPEYLIQQRRGEENLLVQLFARQQLEAVSVPSAADINRFIQENPSMFAQRSRMQLEQIRFERPRDVALLRQLEPAKTMDQVIAVLQRLNLRFERGRSALDTGTLPKQIVDTINRLPPGEIFILPDGNLLVANLIVAREPLPVPDDVARTLAARAVRQQKAEAGIRQQLENLRTTTKVVYQDGYAPPPAGANGARSGGTGAAPVGAVPTGPATPAGGASASPTGGATGG